MTYNVIDSHQFQIIYYIIVLVCNKYYINIILFINIILNTLYGFRELE